MTNVFGSGAPEVGTVADDAGPLQLGVAFTVGVPCVITHMRYYVASDLLSAEISGSLDYYLWLHGDPDTTVTGTLTIPASAGWVTDELSPPMFVPAGRTVGAAVGFPTADPIHYGATFLALPAANKLITAQVSGFEYDPAPFNAYTAVPSWTLNTSYLIDLEVAVSEMVHLAPADMADGDVLQIQRTINGTVNPTGVTPITDAYTVNLHVDGGPLDGTDVDVWVPDTNDGLLAADMVLLKEVDAPDVGSLWEASDGSLWVYQGGAVYDCFAPGTVYPEGAKTTRADTPSLLTWSP